MLLVHQQTKKYGSYFELTVSKSDTAVLHEYFINNVAARNM